MTQKQYLKQLNDQRKKRIESAQKMKDHADWLIDSNYADKLYDKLTKPSIIDNSIAAAVSRYRKARIKVIIYARYDRHNRVISQCAISTTKPATTDISNRDPVTLTDIISGIISYNRVKYQIKKLRTRRAKK